MPFTAVAKRLARKDPPVSQLDGYAMEHDIAYQHNKGNPKKIREADQKLIQQVAADGHISSIEATLVKSAMKGKMKLEDLGLKPYPEFSGAGVLKPPRADPAGQLRKQMLKKFGVKKNKDTVKKNIVMEIMKHVKNKAPLPQ